MGLDRSCDAGAAMTDILTRLENPPFGTETSERNLVKAASESIRETKETLIALDAWVRHWQDDVAANLKPTPSSLAEARARIAAALAKVQP